ncbi:MULTISPECIES: helix-turn-helix domain-containing protein [unclassified Mycobacterium]|uniref:helix-turn-helix domain-containing protein n=1 Tax=unclassified Mycobacterium TaxID=2642494 RepID=UPI0029C7F2AA|nr:MULTISPECIES: helix-turn-helix domain-containing protein [unclassified Mycobacterium]
MAESHTDGFLTPAQLADKWQISLRTVHRYLAEGRVKSIKLPGGQYRIRPEDAEAAIEASA